MTSVVSLSNSSDQIKSNQIKSNQIKSNQIHVLNIVMCLLLTMYSHENPWADFKQIT